MKKSTKLFIPLLVVPSMAGVVAPLVSCSETNKEVTISFYSVGGGAITSDAQLTVQAGTKWADVTKPTYKADASWVFMGWFNGNIPMVNDDIITNDMVITARFAANPETVMWTESYYKKEDGTAQISYYISDYDIVSSIVIPSQIITTNDGMLKVTEVIFNQIKGVKSVYIPKTVTNITIAEQGFRSALAYLFVDPENEVYTSQDKEGNECCCVMTKYDASSYYKQSLLFGTGNTIIPSTVDCIDDLAFYESKIRSVVLPEGLKKIGIDAFRRCNFVTVDIPKTVEEIDEGAFKECKYLETLNIPADSQMTVFGGKNGQVLRGSTKLQAFSLPDNVEYFASSCLDDCTSLKSLHIGKKCTDIFIDYDEIKSLPALESITVDKANTKYSSGSTESNVIIDKNDGTLLYGVKTSSIPSEVTKIGDSAFSGCEELPNVTIPNKVTSIGKMAFYKCKSLTSISIPEKVKEIGDSAFALCTGLTSVTLPEGLEKIGYRAFSGCSKIPSIVIPSTVIDDDASNWFSYCTSLTSVEIKGTIVGNSAFLECPNLSKVTIGDKCTKIDYEAFYECTSLLDINIPAAVEEIGSWAFAKSNSLATVSFANNSKLETIGDRAFSNCVSLKQLTLPKNITYIGTNAFYDCQFTDKTINFNGNASDFPNALKDNLTWIENSNIRYVQCLDQKIDLLE